MSSKTKFFCYELNFACRWIGVFYTDQPSNVKVAGKESGPTRSSVWEVSDHLTLEDAYKMHPAPIQTPLIFE